MAGPLLALAVSASLLVGTPKDGEAWLREAEAKLYAWPDPGVVVRFTVKTDVLAKTIDGLRKQLPPDPTPDMVKALDALRRIEITGTVDTSTGKATTHIDLDMDTTDPRRKEGVDKVKEGIDTMVTKAFESLPLHDPSLLGKGTKVVEATDDSGKLAVKVAGSGATGDTLIRMDRARMLPESFQNSTLSLAVRYIEVLPGLHAPSKLDVKLPDGSKSSATYTYQRVGTLVFPATVVVTNGTMSARVEFTSVRVGAPGS